MKAMRNLALAGAVMLAACGSQPEPAEQPAAAAASPAPGTTRAPAPDLAACARPAPLDDSERLRTEPIPVPAALKGVMRTDMENLALSTLGGGTVCVDASWMEALDNARLSPGGRFAAFDWYGYEAFGHVIVDRDGKGTVIDPGVKPLPSPSGNLLAAIDITESGYGPLNAFTVWRLDPAPISQLAAHEEVPAAADWKVERWAGESCVELSAIPWEVYADPAAPADPPREAYHARRTSGWSVEPGRCPAA
jgi:hypothetical protein